MPGPVLVRKPAASRVIEIQHARSTDDPQPPSPASPAGIRKSFQINQYTRRTVIGLFLVGGKSITGTAKRFPGATEKDIEDEIRRELVYGGTLARWGSNEKSMKRAA